MVRRPLIPLRLASSPAFREDLKTFLSLADESLQALARFGREPNGYQPARHASSLSKEANLPVAEARAVVRMASYLYDRTSEIQTTPEEAVDALESLASELQVSFDESKRQSLYAVLEYNRDYEEHDGPVAAITNREAHTAAVRGTWGLRVFETRTGAVVKIPILTLSLVLHEPTGEPQSITLAFTDAQWESFKDDIELISERRSILDHDIE